MGIVVHAGYVKVFNQGHPVDTVSAYRDDKVVSTVVDTSDEAFAYLVGQSKFLVLILINSEGFTVRHYTCIRFLAVIKK